jgi:hypothetical protein
MFNPGKTKDEVISELKKRAVDYVASFEHIDKEYRSVSSIECVNDFKILRGLGKLLNFTVSYDIRACYLTLSGEKNAVYCGLDLLAYAIKSRDYQLNILAENQKLSREFRKSFRSSYSEIVGALVTKVGTKELLQKVLLGIINSELLIDKGDVDLGAKNLSQSVSLLIKILGSDVPSFSSEQQELVKDMLNLATKLF